MRNKALSMALDALVTTFLAASHWRQLRTRTSAQCLLSSKPPRGHFRVDRLTLGLGLGGCEPTPGESPAVNRVRTFDHLTER